MEKTPSKVARIDNNRMQQLLIEPSDALVNRVLMAINAVLDEKADGHCNDGIGAAIDKRMLLQKLHSKMCAEEKTAANVEDEDSRMRMVREEAALVASSSSSTTTWPKKAGPGRSYVWNVE